MVIGLILGINIVTLGFEAAKGLAPIFGVTAMGVSVAIIPIISLLTRRFAFKEAHLDNAFSKVTEEKA